jgi:hypothetical protein
MFQDIISEWNSLKESISKFHELPIFLPESFIQGTLLPTIAVVAVTLTIVYLLAFSFVDKIVPPGTDAVKKSKVCYQISEFVHSSPLPTQRYA